MPNDPTFWVAAAALLGAVLFVAKRPGGASALGGRGPGRALIDAVEEAKRDGAGKLIEHRLGEHGASTFAAELAAALNTPAAGPPAPKGP